KTHCLELGDPADSLHGITIVEAIAPRCALYRFKQPHVFVKMDGANRLAGRFRQFTYLKQLSHWGSPLTCQRNPLRSQSITQTQSSRTCILTGRSSYALNDGEMSMTCGRFFFAVRHAKNLVRVGDERRGTAVYSKPQRQF